MQSFGDLAHRPLLVDLTIEEGTRLKVIYGSAEGFHAIDLDSSTVYDIYIPKHVRTSGYSLALSAVFLMICLVVPVNLALDFAFSKFSGSGGCPPGLALDFD